MATLDNEYTPLSAVENPEVRSMLEHIKEMRGKDFSRYCALCDLLDIVVNEAVAERERDFALYLLNLDRYGHVDKWREEYMKEHGGSDGTEEQAKAMEEVKKQVLEALQTGGETPSVSVSAT
jgi:hypothetical protein